MRRPTPARRDQGPSPARGTGIAPDCYGLELRQACAAPPWYVVFDPVTGYAEGSGGDSAVKALRLARARLHERARALAMAPDLLVRIRRVLVSRGDITPGPFSAAP